MVPLENYLVLSAIIFSLGVYGVLARRNAVLILMSVELMLNAVSLNFIAFAAYLDPEQDHRRHLRRVRYHRRRRGSRPRARHRHPPVPQPRHEQCGRSGNHEVVEGAVSNAWELNRPGCSRAVPAGFFLVLALFGRYLPAARATSSASLAIGTSFVLFFFVLVDFLGIGGRH